MGSMWQAGRQLAQAIQSKGPVCRSCWHSFTRTGWRGEVGPGEVERWAQVRWRRAGRPVGVSIAKNLMGQDWFGLETARCLFLVMWLFLLFVFLLLVVLVLVFILYLLLPRARSRARVCVFVCVCVCVRERERERERASELLPWVFPW